MATMKRTPQHTDELFRRPTENDSGAIDPAENRRQRRLEALKTIAGLWADRDDIPADGLEYQRQMRSE